MVSRWERILLAACVVAFCVSFLLLLRRFYVESTILRPSPGGTYIEGSVGELQSLIPWFTVTNDVNRDIVSLVFAGLLKYNPETKRIEEDLATLSVSADKRIYTLTLKDAVFWHDHTAENPHPVTADDVLFTFKTIQDPAFPNQLLRQNFLGVSIDKINDRAIRFKLDEPYSFFASNLTIGLLPKQSFEGIPPSKMDQAVDFGTAPVGAGPYTFKSITETEISTEVTLERFSRSLEPTYHLNQVIFRIFPDYVTLLSDIRNLDGVRLVPRGKDGNPIVPRQFKASNYTLPQYVAMFLNLERPILRDQNLRLGLQLGTDKQAIIDAIGETTIVDTPLLELDATDWRYKFSPQAAQGALFSSNWHLPEKIRLQRLLEMKEANDVGPLRIDPVVLLDTGAVLTVTGSVIDAGSGELLGHRVTVVATATGTWTVALPTANETGSLRLGYNLVKLTNRKGAVVDSFYLWRTSDPKEFRRAAEEQRLLALFVQSRDKPDTLDEDERITAQDLFLDRGMLRRRIESDPVEIRMNDKGDSLKLKLLTTAAPPQYGEVARLTAEQWRALGVDATVEVVASRSVFEDKLLHRDYDVLLFGQSLLDNLDSFPYWHSSGVQKLTGNRNDLRLDAYNLSQYSSLEADSLLELIRKTQDEKERQQALGELKEILKTDVPAIFLYSPLYTFGYNKELRGVKLGALSLHSDRFLTLHNWFVKEERVFLPGKSWWSFPGWLLSLIHLS
ncbi:TPA: hypothetical protein DCL30_03175 [Candidatus Peribacteria bacterium]|nr:MAG: hypothetical protein A2529_05535 [Candidatus Peribacteria bacterium RIFOXYD2_FULL_58_15]HAI98520.1 hypothetical protein [Candidatus Peribacteria bacterium]HAS34232.1 hypothetical protein [Candidatus Peribacteria bacterium]